MRAIAAQGAPVVLALALALAISLAVTVETIAAGQTAGPFTGTPSCCGRASDLLQRYTLRDAVRDRLAA